MLVMWPSSDEIACPLGGGLVPGRIWGAAVDRCHAGSIGRSFDCTAGVRVPREISASPPLARFHRRRLRVPGRSRGARGWPRSEAVLSRVATGHPAIERISLSILILLSVVLISGRPLTSSVGSERQVGAEDSASSLTARDVEVILGSVNPILDPRSQRRIAAAVMRYSAQYELEPELVTAVLLVESHARPWAVSSKGAVGLMQVMPHMMRPLGLVGNATTVEGNIEAGCYILANNIRRLGEDRGISSYFWGNRIRGVAYLEKVRATREELRRRRPS